MVVPRRFHPHWTMLGLAARASVLAIVLRKEFAAIASQDSWSGWIVFAAFVLLIVGAMDMLQGCVGILRSIEPSLSMAWKSFSDCLAMTSSPNVAMKI